MPADNMEPVTISEHGPDGSTATIGAKDGWLALVYFGPEGMLDRRSKSIVMPFELFKRLLIAAKLFAACLFFAGCGGAPEPAPWPDLPSLAASPCAVALAEPFAVDEPDPRCFLSDDGARGAAATWGTTTLSVDVPATNDEWTMPTAGADLLLLQAGSWGACSGRGGRVRAVSGTGAWRIDVDVQCVDQDQVAHRVLGSIGGVR